MFGKKTRNTYRPPTDPKELAEEYFRIENKTSTLSYSERCKVMISYMYMKMEEKQKDKEDGKDK
jgi:hypothetical protein